jgi:hypothetical protein
MKFIPRLLKPMANKTAVTRTVSMSNTDITGGVEFKNSIKTFQPFIIYPSQALYIAFYKAAKKMSRKKLKKRPFFQKKWKF